MKMDRYPGRILVQINNGAQAGKIFKNSPQKNLTYFPEESSFSIILKGIINNR